jgi:folylpolyglutamate synthase/dihydropteroate synthase
MLHGRDPSAIIGELAGARTGTVVACTAPSERALPATEIAEAARALGLRALSTDSVDDAVTLALARVAADGALVVTGSLYVVADARGRFVSSGRQHSE